MQSSALRNIMQRGFGSGSLRQKLAGDHMQIHSRALEHYRQCRHLGSLIASTVPYSPHWGENMTSHPYVMSISRISISQTYA